MKLTDPLQLEGDMSDIGDIRPRMVNGEALCHEDCPAIEWRDEDGVVCEERKVLDATASCDASAYVQPGYPCAAYYRAEVKRLRERLKLGPPGTTGPILTNLADTLLTAAEILGLQNERDLSVMTIERIHEAVVYLSDGTAFEVSRIIDEYKAAAEALAAASSDSSPRTGG